MSEVHYAKELRNANRQPQTLGDDYFHLIHVSKITPKATATIRIDELLLTKPNQLNNFYSCDKKKKK